MSRSPVEETARKYAMVKRRIDSGDIDEGGLMRAIMDRDWAFHDLLVALDMPCDCERKTCPGNRSRFWKSRRRLRTP